MHRGHWGPDSGRPPLLKRGGHGSAQRRESHPPDRRGPRTMAKGKHDAHNSSHNTSTAQASHAVMCKQHTAAVHWAAASMLMSR